MKRKVSLPEPEEALGLLASEDAQEWPVEYHPDHGEQPYLRETEAHATLIFHFAKCLVGHKEFEAQCKRQLLHTYLSAGQERTVVMLYYNKYEQWKAEFTNAPANKGVGTEDESTMGTAVSSVTNSDQSACPASSSVPARSTSKRTVVKPRFTEDGMKSGREYSGWNEFGQNLFGRTGKLLMQQVNDQVLSSKFEQDLLERFRSETDSLKGPARVEKKEVEYFDQLEDCAFFGAKRMRTEAV